MTAAVVAVLLVVLAGAIWLFQRSLIYLPSRGEVPPAASVIPGAEDVVLRTDDGLELDAWFVPAASGGTGVVVLLAPGNAGDRADRAPLAEQLAAEGISTLLLDYRGYGGNPGSPSEEGLALDVRAARRYLVEERGVPEDRLLYFGESLGAAAVAELATEHPPAGMVLRSPFRDLASMAREHYPFLPSWLLREELDVAGHVAQVDAPVVVVYGTEDSIVPPEQSRAVARAARNLHAGLPVAGADHNDFALLSGEPVVAAVVRLAGRVTP